MLKQLTFALAVLALVAMPATTHAVQVTFTLDSSQSDVTLLAYLSGVPLLEQLPGSGTAPFSGTIVVDVDDSWAPTQLELIGGGLAVGADYAAPLLPGLDATAANPGTPATSVFGVMGTHDGTPTGTPVLLAALRDLSLDVTGPQEAVDGSGQFSSDLHTFNVVTTTFDGWQAGTGLIAHDDLSGQEFANDVGSASSSYVVSGNTATLTIVINSHEPSDSFQDTYEGFLIGTALVPGPSTIPGDANIDGAVDVTDLGILATNYGLTSGAEWALGDFTGDGAVNVSDLGVLATYYGQSATVAGVPEPSTFVGVLIMCLAGLLARAHRKR